MTYSAGNSIQASDYNTFATAALGMNQIFADLYPGATTLPNAGYGYGQTPALTSVSIGNNVTAAQWTALFQTIRKSGTHQGTVVVPPLPVADPVIGDTVTAYNTPSTLATLITLLGTNRFNLAIGQSFMAGGTPYPQTSGVWTNSLTWTIRVDLGTWDSARYFFNTGSFLGLNGSYSPVVTPEDAQWQSMFTTMSPLKFSANATAPASGSGGTAIGFYQLTTSFQPVYFKSYGAGGYYNASYIQVDAKLAAAAGTNGQIDFRVLLVDNDSSLPKDPKNGITTYRIDNTRASGGNVAWPGTVTTSLPVFISS